MTGRYAEKKRRPRWGLMLILLVLLAAILLARPAAERIVAECKVRELETVQVPEWVDVQLIGVDGASRRGQRLEDINDIVIHYVGNPGTTAQQNRNYYENPGSGVSSHFVVGLQGEVIQCIPLWEKSSASNNRNRDTISIEVCHPDESGKFNDVTYEALVKLTAWLLEATGLDAEHIIRHYDITGKECPRYFVTNGDSWRAFKTDVARAME